MNTQPSADGDDGILFRCSLCGLEQRYRSIQKGVGQNWRKAEFLIHSRALWFCPNHFIVGYELNKTIEFTVEILKVDIVESVRERVLLDETLSVKLGGDTGIGAII